MPFPQALSLAGALQEAQLQLLGKIMGVCAAAEQVGESNMLARTCLSCMSS